MPRRKQRAPRRNEGHARVHGSAGSVGAGCAGGSAAVPTPDVIIVSDSEDASDTVTADTAGHVPSSKRVRQTSPHSNTVDVLPSRPECVLPIDVVGSICAGVAAVTSLPPGVLVLCQHDLELGGEAQARVVPETAYICALSPTYRVAVFDIGSPSGCASGVDVGGFDPDLARCLLVLAATQCVCLLATQRVVGSPVLTITVLTTPRLFSRVDPTHVTGRSPHERRVARAICELFQWLVPSFRTGSGVQTTINDVYRWSKPLAYKEYLSTTGAASLSNAEPDASSTSTPHSRVYHQLVCTLKPYQTAAVEWMMSREAKTQQPSTKPGVSVPTYSTKPGAHDEREPRHATLHPQWLPVHLHLAGATVYVNLQFGQVSLDPVVRSYHVSGGILADEARCRPVLPFALVGCGDIHFWFLLLLLLCCLWCVPPTDQMGLGKTVMVLALVLGHKRQRHSQSSQIDASTLRPGETATHPELGFIPLEQSACWCGNSFAPTGALPWIRCYGCQRWTHSVCAGHADLAESHCCGGVCLDQYSPTLRIGGVSTKPFVKPQLYCETHEAQLKAGCTESELQDRHPFVCVSCRKFVRHGLVESGATIIVCPDTLLSQWEYELRRHTTAGALRTLVRVGKLACVSVCVSVSEHVNRRVCTAELLVACDTDMWTHQLPSAARVISCHAGVQGCESPLGSACCLARQPRVLAAPRLVNRGCRDGASHPLRAATRPGIPRHCRRGAVLVLRASNRFEV